jgi:steroid Delta-isomerase
VTAAGALDERIAGAVRGYLAAVATGTAAEIAACYAEDATLEDPVGSEPTRGRAAITEFYSAIESLQRETELLAVRVSGNAAAFHFRVRTHLPGQVVEVEPIDTMTFDDAGLITAMRAYWSPSDVRVAG